MADPKKKPGVSEGTKAPTKFTGGQSVSVPSLPSPPRPEDVTIQGPSMADLIFSPQAIDAVMNASKSRVAPLASVLPPRVTKAQSDAYKVLEQSHARGIPGHTQMGAGAVVIEPDAATRNEWAVRRDFAKERLQDIENMRAAGDPNWVHKLPMSADAIPFPVPSTEAEAKANREAYREEVLRALQQLRNEADAQEPTQHVVAPKGWKQPEKVLL